MSIDKEFKKKFEKEVGPLTFALYMRVCRNSLNLTQSEFGKTLKLSRANICDIEKGRQLVSPEFALKVAKLAGLSEEQAIRACLQDQLNKVHYKAEVLIRKLG